MKQFLTLVLFLIPLKVGTWGLERDWVEYTQEIEKQIKEELRAKRELEIQALLFVIREIESNQRYYVKGGSGEYGAYQFTLKTWDYYCEKFFGERLNIRIPENQDKVAKAKVEYYLEQGYTLEMIFALWNSGSPYGWENKKGVNRWGVLYNVPNYVSKAKELYNSVT